MGPDDAIRDPTDWSDALQRDMPAGVMQACRERGAIIVEWDETDDGILHVAVDPEPGRGLMALGGLQVELERILGRRVHVIPRAPEERWASDPQMAARILACLAEEVDRHVPMVGRAHVVRYWLFWSEQYLVHHVGAEDWYDALARLGVERLLQAARDQAAMQHDEGAPNTRIGSTFDDFLDNAGIRDAVERIAQQRLQGEYGGAESEEAMDEDEGADGDPIQLLARLAKTVDESVPIDVLAPQLRVLVERAEALAMEQLGYESWDALAADIDRLEGSIDGG